jgi:hypothetical protein
MFQGLTVQKVGGVCFAAVTRLDVQRHLTGAVRLVSTLYVHL